VKIETSFKKQSSIFYPVYKKIEVEVEGSFALSNLICITLQTFHRRQGYSRGFD
jgi:hypothetical protein